MSNRARTFALLVSVGAYQKNECESLPGECDLNLMHAAMEEGLKIEKDNIRSLGENGQVFVYSFARSIAEFRDLLREEDSFIFYFSGHGREGELVFSDGAVTLDSIVGYINKLKAKQKIVILDCCYAGQAKIDAAIPFVIDASLASFAGTGLAVMASCAADQKSWTADGGSCSLYTQILSTAIRSRRQIRKGRLSLADINAEVRYLMGRWNLLHPDRAQQPVFRDNMIGTVFFQVEEYHPYVPQKVYLETDEYTVRHVKPMSTANQKRLAAFVLLKSGDDSRVVETTRQIVSQLRYSDVFASAQSENRLRGKPADVIWCYFGHDETDLMRGNHFACTTWAGDEKLRETYFKKNRNAEIVDDIHVFWNTSYELVKALQKTDRKDEDIKAEYQKLSDLLIRHAEVFVHDLEEVENGTIEWKTVKTAGKKWISEVKELFFRLTDADVGAPEHNAWAEQILEMAGWVVDLAVYMEQNDADHDPSRRWMIKETIRRYQEKLAALTEDFS